MINHVKNYKLIHTNISDFTLVGIRCPVNIKCRAKFKDVTFYVLLENLDFKIYFYDSQV